MPRTYRKKTQSTEMLLTRYLRFYKEFLEGDDEVVRKYRQKIFGPAADLIQEVPFRLSEINIATEMMPLHEWDSLPVKIKAEILASLRIKNMRETLTRHLEVQAMEKERREHARKGNNQA